MESFVDKLSTNIINPLIFLLFAAAAVVFAFGLFRFLANASNETEKEQGKKHMTYGLIGLFIMVAVFGLINVLLGSFGLDPITP